MTCFGSSSTDKLQDARAAKGKRAARGRLRGSIYYKPLGGCEEVLVVLRFVQALPYWLFSFVLSSVLLLPLFSFVLGGAADWGGEERGAPV